MMTSNSGFWQQQRMLATECTGSPRERNRLFQLCLCRKVQLFPLFYVQNAILRFNSVTDRKSLLNPGFILNPDLHWLLCGRESIFYHKWFTSLVNSDQVNPLNISREPSVYQSGVGCWDTEEKDTITPLRRSQSSQLQVRNHEG